MFNHTGSYNKNLQCINTTQFPVFFLVHVGQCITPQTSSTISSISQQLHCKWTKPTTTIQRTAIQRISLIKLSLNFLNISELVLKSSHSNEQRKKVHSAVLKNLSGSVLQSVFSSVPSWLRYNFFIRKFVTVSGLPNQAYGPRFTATSSHNRDCSQYLSMQQHVSKRSFDFFSFHLFIILDAILETSLCDVKQLLFCYIVHMGWQTYLVISSALSFDSIYFPRSSILCVLECLLFILLPPSL